MLELRLPEFDWRIAISRRRDIGERGREESIHAITPISYLKMATFCASVGLLIGALGASFQEQTHFQHVNFVDDALQHATPTQ